MTRDGREQRRRKARASSAKVQVEKKDACASLSVVMMHGVYIFF